MTTHEIVTGGDAARLRFHENASTESHHHQQQQHLQKTVTTVTNPGNPRRTSIIIEERPRTSVTVGIDESDAFHHLFLPTVSEFIGTLMYVLFTNLFGISGTSSISKLGIAIMDGALLAALISALAPFGGLHFNPGTFHSANELFFLSCNLKLQLC